MNTFKHKSLYAAIAGLGALGATGVAQAVSVNHDGLGQALIYPYYTVRSVNPDPVITGAPDFAYNSLLSVVNSTASAKAVKVRFLEGRNSREVLDFNLYLSAKDVWTAAIIPTTDGAAIFTDDKSCTNPRVSSSSLIPTPFVNFGYTGSNDDKAGTTLDRTREGYVEIIEMGNVIGPTAVAVTHVSGVPPAWPACSLPTASADTIAGTGGLFGSMTLINVLRGEDFGIDPVALDGFSSTALWFPPGDINPNLANVNPKTSVVVAGSNVFITDWSASTNTVDPVSAVLMHNNVYNEFVLAKETNSGTDWVVNFPTKNYYYSSAGVVQKLFQNNFTATGACDDVVLTQYDREERTVISQTSFSPPPPTTDRLPLLGNQRDLVQRHQRAGLEEQVDSADAVQRRLGRPELQRRDGSGRTPPVDRRRLDGVQHQDRHHDRPADDDVQRPAGRRLRRDHVRKRHALGGATRCVGPVELRRQLQPQDDVRREVIAFVSAVLRGEEQSSPLFLPDVPAISRVNGVADDHVLSLYSLAVVAMRRGCDRARRPGRCVRADCRGRHGPDVQQSRHGYARRI